MYNSRLKARMLLSVWELFGRCHVLERIVDGRIAETGYPLALLAQLEFQVSKALFYHILKRCIAVKDLNLGRRVRAQVMEVAMTEMHS